MRSGKKTPQRKSSRSRKLARYRDNLGALRVMRCLLEEAEERLLGLIAGKRAGAVATGDECPDLSDPNAPPPVYLCQLLARIDYLLGLIDCDEYKKRVADCAINP